MSPSPTKPDLSAERRALFDSLLAEAGETPRPAAAIPRLAEDAEAPLSFAQERFWFLDRLQPGSPVYNITRLVPLFGAVDSRLLRETLLEIARRHEILRARYRLAGRRPVQVVDPEPQLSVAESDRSDLDPAAAQAELSRWMRAESSLPFDLERGPVLRAALLRLAGDRAFLLLTLHHIAADAWSIEILVRELEAIYGRLAGFPSEPPAEPVLRYRDYAAWQREQLGGAALESKLVYWRDRLAGVPGVLELPADRPRPLATSGLGALREFAVPLADAERLRAFAHAEQVTLFLLVLGIWSVQLARYAGATEVTIGTPVSNRSRSELEGLIGLFLNTLALRVATPAKAGFRAHLRSLREAVLGDFGHADLPFEALVEDLRPARNLNVTPLFQVLLVVQTFAAAGRSGGEGTNRVDAGNGTTKFDLSLYLSDLGAGGMSGTWEYAVDLFDPPTIERMSGHFSHLVAALLDDPERTLGELPLLTPAERQQLFEWNDRAAGLPGGGPPCRWIEEQAERMPDAVALALSAEDEQAWSYRFLNREANRLAHRLRGLGVGPEARVALCVERSAEMVIGLLAILKAGGVHLPLDPTLPRERLAFVLEDSGAAVLLVQRHLVGRLPAVAVPVHRLDADRGDLAKESPENPAGETPEEGLAYVLYTSGSTGRPKGVGMAHSALSNLVFWQNGFGARSATGQALATLQFTSFGFDVSVLEILSTLSSGGRLTMMTEAVRQDLAAVARLLARSEIERLFLPFTALEHLAEAVRQDEAGRWCLRQVISTGEALHLTESVARLFAAMPNTELINEYGPTETHFVTAEILRRGDPGDWPALPAIGRPIPNSGVFLLDRELQPVPIGVPGELYAAGAVLARGYLGRPDLTADRFRPHVAPDGPGQRIYRTGDLARYRADGRIDYLGRFDQQVKIRGFRIELGEIEVTLSKHPALREVAVTARPDGRGGRRLVAYLVAGREPTPSTPELRTFLLERLPEYMVPTAFVWLERLPLGATGKVDRLRLPDPELARPGDVGAYVAPRSPVEEELAQVWAELLFVDRVGIHDDFFELGGHSLLATQLATRIRERFGVELALRQIFESPTIADLALGIVRAQIEGEDREALGRMLEELEGLDPDEVRALLESEDLS